MALPSLTALALERWRAAAELGNYGCSDTLLPRQNDGTQCGGLDGPKYERPSVSSNADYAQPFGAASGAVSH